MLFIVLPPAEAKNWDFTVKFSNLVVQRPTTAVISAVLCFLIATFLGSLRQFGKWYLSTMHPVLVTDERGQCEEIMVDMPPGIISGISYIDRDSHGPTRRLKLIRLVLWLPLVITAFYAGAVGAILIQIDLNSAVTERMCGGFHDANDRQSVYTVRLRYLPSLNALDEVTALDIQGFQRVDFWNVDIS